MCSELFWQKCEAILKQCEANLKNFRFWKTKTKHYWQKGGAICKSCEPNLKKKNHAILKTRLSDFLKKVNYAILKNLKQFWKKCEAILKDVKRFWKTKPNDDEKELFDFAKKGDATLKKRWNYFEKKRWSEFEQNVKRIWEKIKQFWKK